MGNPERKTTVYYDGLCLVCSAEINHYKRRNVDDRVAFVDICAAGFDPAKEGLDPRLIHKIMHVRRRDGTMATRVEAFIEIWENFPGYRWAARVARWKPVRFVLELGYSSFVVIRPWLPRRKAADCSASPYCDINEQKPK